VSTEWIVLIWFIKYVVNTYTYYHKKMSLGTGNQIDSWAVFSRAATRSCMKMYIRKTNLQKKR